MKQKTETDDELLALAFPAFAGDIKPWRAINNRLDELCRDFLTLKRCYISTPLGNVDCETAFHRDLREAMDELNTDIETLLNRMNSARHKATNGKQS